MVSYGLLSTYPPTQCGLATFTAALLRALAPHGGADHAGVVRVVDSPTFADRDEVVGHLVSGATDIAAAVLDRHDVVIVQHEFGIYGGTDGDEVVDLLRQVHAPVIAVLHTVMRKPSPYQRAVVEMIASLAGAVVVLSESARTQLFAGYTVDGAKVHVIPHGRLEQPPMRIVSLSGQPTILTWGLLGPGKGIEWVLAGLRTVRHLAPRPQYVIAGQTHPRVLAERGEAYRLGLYQKARAFGVADMVRFERAYLNESALARLVGRAHIVVLPYDSRDQATSGVLVEALGAGKPVISTPFPHAVELLGGGAGLLVPHGDGAAIGAALKQLLTDSDLADSMGSQARQSAVGVDWTTVAAHYRNLAETLLRTATAV